MKILSLFLALFLLAFASPAQDNTYLLRQKLDDVFSLIDKSQIPTGVLEEYGYGFVDLKEVTASKNIDEKTWRLIYATLYSARISGTQALPELSATNALIQSNLSNAPIILHYAYSSLRPDAVTANLLRGAEQ